MPRSRSKSPESITRSATASFWRNTPLCRSSWSTRVVLPWSTWAIIATFRKSSLFAMIPIVPFFSVTLNPSRGAGALAPGLGEGRTFGGRVFSSNVNRGRFLVLFAAASELCEPFRHLSCGVTRFALTDLL